MKNLKDIIIEKLTINSKTKIVKYNYFPKTKNELIKLVNKLIKERGNEANLNDINTSNIKDMSYIFVNTNFNGDISKWDVSNVTNMVGMFQSSNFNGDISEWDVSNVTNISWAFAYSKFNSDLSNWDISNVKYMINIFHKCPLKNNPPKWYKE